jgi:integrase
MVGGAVAVKRSAESEWRGNPYKRPGSPYWSFVFRDAAGVVRRRSAKTRDLRIAREKLAEAIRDAEQQKAGHVDHYAETRTTPTADLVVAFKAHLEAERRTAVYVKAVVRQIRAYLAFACPATVSSIHPPEVERFLDQIRERHSVKTRDNYAGALRAFGRWLERSGRWGVDPFRTVRTRTPKRDKHRTYKRHSFRFSEAERLVEAAWARFQAEKAKSEGGCACWPDYDEIVRDRQMLYWLALTTGFRVAECAALRWEDIAFDERAPCIRLAGQFTKNGLDARVPLQPFVIQALKDMRSRRSQAVVRRGEPVVTQTDHVFRVPRTIAELVRKDAAFAGLIPEKSPTSKRVDFHALRKSCARILIELNVHPKIIQAVLRHSDIRLTMDLYGELGEDDLLREMPGRFPVPRMYAAEPSAPEPVASTTA